MSTLDIITDWVFADWVSKGPEAAQLVDHDSDADLHG
jgi:hypothetical protein